MGLGTQEAKLRSLNRWDTGALWKQTTLSSISFSKNLRLSIPSALLQSARLKMERETRFEPVTSSLGSQTYVGSRTLARFCCESLNLQRLAKSAFSKFKHPNEAQMRHALFAYARR